jgi:hypothetical protein
MMPSAERESPSRVALHEAGHAVVALHFGLTLHYATIRPCEFSEIIGAAGCINVETSAAAGHVWMKWPSPDVDWEPACVMVLSGPAAERHQFGDAKYGAGDVTRVRELVALLDLFDLQRCRKPTEADVDTGMLPYHAKADRVVVDNWVWIQRTAEELDRLIGLGADEIAALEPAP